MSLKKVVFSFLLLSGYAHSASDYDISESKCIAWSQHQIKGEYSYTFSPAVPYGGGIQVSFMAHNLKNKNQEHIDDVIVSKVNGRMISFAVQGHQSMLVFRPQDKSDTAFILDAATTGSITFGGMILKTGGTKNVVNYMMASCKS